MAISILQEANATLGSGAVASISVAFSSPVTPGSSLHVFAYAHLGSGGLTGGTFSDSVNGSYGSTLANLTANANQDSGSHAKFDNTAAGTPTVTFTPNISAAFMRIWIKEVGNSSGYDVQASLYNDGSSGPGTDKLTTGNATPSQQPGLISAFMFNINSSGTTVPGTGFSLGVDHSTDGMTEQLRYTSTAAAAGTSTTTGTVVAFAHAAWFKEAAAAGGVSVAWLT